MKKIDEIIKEAKLVDLLNGQVTYCDEIPSSANEMNKNLSVENIPLSLIKMRYWDGTIDVETHNKYRNQLDDFMPCKVYEELIFVEDLSEDKARNFLNNSELLDCLIELRLCLPKEAKENDNELFGRYSKFTEVFFLLYCESLRIDKPEKRLRTWAIKGFEHYDESTFSPELYSRDEEFFIICKAHKNPEDKNSIFGIVQIDENNQNCSLTENQSNNSNSKPDWLSDFIRPKEDKPNGTATCMDNK